MTEPQRVRARWTADRLFVLAAFGLSLVLAVLLLIGQADIAVISAIGWLFVVLAVYLASLLVP